MNTALKRVLADLLIFLSLFLLPWWCTAILAIAAIFIFEWFYEAVVFGFIMDSLYGVPASFFHNFTFAATLATAALLAITAYVKPKLR